jgi:hypothetical protein
VTVTVLFWSAVRIVYWLSHTPSLYGVLSLVLPLFVLPLLASAYAEVNYEGIVVLQVNSAPSLLHSIAAPRTRCSQSLLRALDAPRTC